MKRTFSICRLAGLVALAWLSVLPVSLRAQNASPLGGAPLQLFDQNGVLLTSGVIYSYVGATSTPVAVYIDGSATTQQPNPTPFGASARVSLFYLNGTFVKIIICLQNDGAFCSAGDILASMDMIPIGSSASSGNTGTFTGLFISGTASPATSGVLRLASGDSICFRNAAGSSNLCFKKDSTDLFSWDGGSFKLPEVGAPAGQLGFDILWADNTAHRLKATNNGGAAAQYVLSGNDVDTTDAVTKWHFGATQTPLSATPPATNQFLQWNGTNIVGAPLVLYDTATSEAAASFPSTTLFTVGGSDASYSLSAYLVQTVATSGCSAQPSLNPITVTYTDGPTNASRVANVQFTNENGLQVGTSPPFAASLGITTTFYAFPIYLRAKASTTISAAATYIAGTGCSPGATYTIVPVLEAK